MTVDERFQLLHGEALQQLSQMPSASVDLICTDPPYSSGGFTRSDRTNTDTRTKYVSSDTLATRPEFAGDNRDQRGFLHWCALWMAEALRVCKPGGSIVVFTDWRQLPTMTDAVQCGGWVWQGLAIWDKKNARPRNGIIPWAEFAVWGTAGQLRQDWKVYVPSIIRASAPKADARQHTTEKPVDLMSVLVTLAPPGGVVLDPFMGSGTTGVAAVQAGRKFIGCEIDDHYYTVAEDRLQRSSQHSALFVVEPSEAVELFEVEEV